MWDSIQYKAQRLFDIVKDVLDRFDLPLTKFRDQCYDGAANVSGKISELQQRIKEEESQTLDMHCNALNLAIPVGIEKVLSTKKNSRGRTFVRDSPKHIAQFKGLQANAEESENKVTALLAYCPTR